MNLVLTCEHGGNRVPAALRGRFEGQQGLLASHRGFDRGALAAARRLARRFGAPLVACTTTRLVADTNRSRSHPHVVSELVADLPRDALLARYWAPHRERAYALVAENLPCVHVAVHSFVQTLHGEIRACDVGLLYDPSRETERVLAHQWKRGLTQVAPSLRVRRNHPYRGRDDGLTRHLRRLHAPDRYVGIELELGEAILARDGRGVVERVGDALEAALR